MDEDQDQESPSPPSECPMKKRKLDDSPPVVSEDPAIPEEESMNSVPDVKEEVQDDSDDDGDYSELILAPHFLIALI